MTPHTRYSIVNLVTRNPGWFVAALSCALYLATLSHHHTADSILYAMAVEQGDSAHMLDPYHFLLHPLGWGFYQLWQLAGWSNGSLIPLQVLNAAAGAACAGLVAAVGAHLGQSNRVGLLVGMGFAVSGGAWLLSVEAEFVTVPLATALLVLWALLVVNGETARRPAYAVLLGLGVALATLAYLTGLLLIPVVLIGLLMDNRVDQASRKYQALSFLGVTFLTLAPLIGFGLAWWSGGEWAAVAQYLGGGSSYGRFGWTNLPSGAYAFLRSLALFPNLAMNDNTRLFLAGASNSQRWIFMLYYLAVAVLAVMPLILAWRTRQRLWNVHRRTTVVLTTWAILYGSFALFWVPADVSFWMPALVAWWLLLALLMSVRNSSLKSSRTEWILLGVVLALGLSNAMLSILPRHDLSTNRSYELAKTLSAHTLPQDRILLSGDGLSALHVDYFGQRQVSYWYPAYEQVGEMLATAEKQMAESDQTVRLYLVHVGTAMPDWYGELEDSNQRIPVGRWRVSSVPWQPAGSSVLELTLRPSD